MKLECGCIISEWKDGMRRRDYCRLHAIIKEWHNRIEKATWNVSTYLFKELLDVVKEMEKEVD
jgi:hypothetical protein